MIEMPKILMLNTYRGFIGGVERLMANMAVTMRENDWMVYGLFEQTAHEDPAFDSVFDDFEVFGDGDFEEMISYYTELGINVVCIHKTTRRNWVKLLQQNFPTAVFVHDHDYYCLRRHKYLPYKRINCYLPFSLVYCPLCSGMVEKSAGNYRLIDFQEKALMLSQIRKCDLSFVLSDYMKHNLLMNKWHASKIVKLIPNATLQEDITTVYNEIPIILYVGQLIRGKGVDLAINALSRVSEPFKFVVLGRGNDENYLKEISAQLLPGKAEFLGWAADVNQIYAGADIVVVPSRWQEPFGLVGLEAFSKSKPVVAFDIGGISEWLKHKVNGLLVY
ncbi:MAG: glycosyltransferase family 4 protein, partial [Candidatus Cloacimonetes bacterium]|nr:glycosyltransferase family 4 protein [Candidatus Cloacimonadota bacterium]